MGYNYPPASNLEKLLEALRTVPADSHATTDEMLSAVSTHLLVKQSTQPGNIHWFCKKAEPLTREAAAFSLRLFAYDSTLVSRWKEVLHHCLRCCSFCVAAFEQGKVTWRHTYFGAFSTELLEQFFTSVEKWECDATISDVESANKSSPPSLPSGTIFRILSNRTIFSDRRVMSSLPDLIPQLPISDWPAQVPPFLPVLMVIDNAKLRTWAKENLSASSSQNARSVLDYSSAISVIVAALGGDDACNNFMPSSPLPMPLAINEDLWTGIHDVLRLIPMSWFQSHFDQLHQLKRVIFSHLQDPSTHFCVVLKLFQFLLKRLARNTWKGEGLEYPQTVFDFIRNNPRFHEELEVAAPPDSGLNFITWIPEFLITIRDSVMYGNIFTEVVNFLAAEIIQDRLRHCRANLLNALMNALYMEFEIVIKDEQLTHRPRVAQLLEKHADLILSAAYTTQNEGADWMRARNKAQDLVELILEENVQSIQGAIRRISEVVIRYKQIEDVRLKVKPEVPPLPTLFVQGRIWKGLYAALQCSSSAQRISSKTLASVLCILSKISHFTPLRPEIFSNAWTSKEGDKLVADINEFLAVIENGFSASISAFSDYAISSDALEVLQCKNVGISVTMLLLSPVEDIQTGAKTLIGLAFDVDGRMECIRSLFANLPRDTFNGIFQFLKTFNRYAELVPEACSLSAMLVLCFADIVDVLCAALDGLLHKDYFLQVELKDGPAALSLEFWKLLTKALCIIYKRTPTWANHVDTPNMVIWMRDALILARDMLKQWRVIENAASATPFTKDTGKSEKRGGISKIGADMIESLQDFLPELLKWLRLTDEELLHQSFALLLSVFDVMKESHITPSPNAISRLSKYVETTNKANEGAAREQKTRLDHGRMSQLSQILLELEAKPEKDEVEIISYTVRPSKDARERKQETEKRPYIQTKLNQKKPVQAKISTSFGGLSRANYSKSSGKDFSKLSERDQQLLRESVPQPSFRKPQTHVGSSNQISSSNKTRSSVEVSEGSSESESSDSSGDDSSLKNLGKVPSPKKLKKPEIIQPTMPKERRQVKMLDLPLNAKASDFSRIRHQASTTRPRLDCSALHKTILAWNYNHTSSIPPGPPLRLVSVPDQFRDYKHYFEVFHPLLLTECWAQILAAKDERRDSYQCKIESRQYVDNWIDLDLTISEAVKKDWYLAETDIVLIRHASQQERCIMAKVKNYRRAMGGIQLTARCYIQRGEVEDPGLTIQSLWQLSKIFSLSTLEREYRALISLPYSDICQFVMQPRLQKVPGISQEDVRETMRKYNVNEPQATAIMKALKTKGISLIQGPPGTGKTSTICGLISQFIADRPRPVVNIVPGNRRGAGEEPGPTARVLVCAPSNAAIDELAQRIRDGQLGSNVSVVRIGPESTISTSIRDISLDYLVDKKLDSTPNFKPSTDIGEEIHSIRQELEAVKASLKQMKDELQDGNPSPARRVTLENELKTLNARRQNLNSKLDQKQDQRKSDSRAQDTARRNARQQVLFKADIICSTLAGSGHESLDNLQFDMVVIDEAAQAIELSSLIPLKTSATQCIMVGDPQQLPPTVISPEATNYRYNQSFFVRLQKSNADAVHLLSIQYRMHPDISTLPSRVFYDSKLLDGPDMAKKTQQPWHKHEKFGTYRFINVSWGFEESVGRSLCNSAECNLAADLFQYLRREYSTLNFDFRIGVVSMYKAQIQALRKTFQDRFGSEIVRKIDFNTVDGFQGQEKDIIILSCVRASTSSANVGFTGDVRRMNVALTRAKSSLFILGHAATLERSDTKWKDIVGDARSRGHLVAVNAKYYSSVGLRPPDMAEPVTKKRKTQQVQPPPELSTPKEYKEVVQGSVSQVSRATTSRLLPTTAQTTMRPSSATFETCVPAVNPPAASDPPLMSESSDAYESSATVQYTRGTKRPAGDLPNKAITESHNPSDPLTGASDARSSTSPASIAPPQPQALPARRPKKKPASIFLPSRRPTKQ